MHTERERTYNWMLSLGFLLAVFGVAMWAGAGYSPVDNDLDYDFGEAFYRFFGVLLAGLGGLVAAAAGFFRGGYRRAGWLMLVAPVVLLLVLADPRSLLGLALVGAVLAVGRRRPNRPLAGKGTGQGA